MGKDNLAELGEKFEGIQEFADTRDLGGVFNVDIKVHLSTKSFEYSGIIDNYTSSIDDMLDVIDAWGAGETGSKTNASLQYRTALENPTLLTTLWSDWKPLTNIMSSARAYEFRLVLSSDDYNYSVIVEEAGYTMSIPKREEDKALSGSHYYNVTFDYPFYQTPRVYVSLYDGASGDYYTISNLTKTGFTIVFYNSSGGGKVSSATVRAIGYGKQVA